MLSTKTPMQATCRRPPAAPRAAQTRLASRPNRAIVRDPTTLALVACGRHIAPTHLIERACVSSQRNRVCVTGTNNRHCCAPDYANIPDTRVASHRRAAHALAPAGRARCDRQRRARPTRCRPMQTPHHRVSQPSTRVRSTLCSSRVRSTQTHQGVRGSTCDRHHSLAMQRRHRPRHESRCDIAMTTLSTGTRRSQHACFAALLDRNDYYHT